jgi:hypothetical protein
MLLRAAAAEAGALITAQAEVLVVSVVLLALT